MAREELLKDIWQKASKLCAMQEKAPSQMYTKLRSYGATEEEASTLLARLENENFVDQERFARAYTADRFRFNKWGRIKIAFNLRRLEIDEWIIEEALTIVDQVSMKKSSSLWPAPRSGHCRHLCSPSKKKKK